MNVRDVLIGAMGTSGYEKFTSRTNRHILDRLQDLADVEPYDTVYFGSMPGMDPGSLVLFANYLAEVGPPADDDNWTVFVDSDGFIEMVWRSSVPAEPHRSMTFDPARGILTEDD